ncbi:MAG: transglycosylase domain-containing protein [Erysipelotrichaceae bacterium]|nr:transglycosylase domain-containing protein [Erysipelotrichaceae bacterium]
MAKKYKLKKGVLHSFKIVVMAFILLITYVGMSWSYDMLSSVESFSVDRLTSQDTSVQVDQDGNEYYYYGSNGVKKNVEYDDIPQIMIDAVISAEDSRFFEHNGFDVPRIIKALMSNISSGSIAAGGSTITQQVIKKAYYPDEQQTITRKIGEVILSIEATATTTKEEILKDYLNNVYFGYGNQAIGIYAACQYYFGKSVQNLTLPEAALLAGTINNPNKYDPYRNLEAAQNRRDTVLNLMLRHGYISEQECEDAKSIPVENTLNYNSLSANNEYQAYADKVTREVYEATGYDPNSTAMVITTYIDTDLQSYLNDIANGDEFDFPDEYMQTGVSVQETTNGRIVGVLAARNYVSMGTSYAYAASKELMATEVGYSYGQRNQPGSSLKPIIAYASAFEYLDYSTVHYVHDIAYSSNGWTPENWDGQVHGDVSIKEALVNSWNLAAIQTLNEVVNEVGTSEMVSYLEGFGFDMYGEEFNLGYAIGSWETGVSPEEEAAAYAAIANGGTYIEPHTVEKIELLETSEVIYIDQEAQENSSQAISEESAFMIRSIMVDYVDDGTGNYAYLDLGYQIGAKTGTSNHDEEAPNESLVGKNKDLWMAAYSPDYSWSVWVGYNYEAQKMGYYPTGSPAAQISGLIAKYLHQNGVKNSYPEQPDGVVEASCIAGIYPYVSPSLFTSSSQIETGYFKENNVPSESTVSTTYALPDLTSFNAEIVNNNQVQVTFANASESTGSQTYNIGGYTFSLPYYSDIYYAVDIIESSGKTVYSEKLTTYTAVLNYTLSAGSYTIAGYYCDESGEITSNQMTQVVVVSEE